MDIRHITQDYAVTPQIAVEDIPAIAAAGFTAIICNRPDGEVPPSHQAAAIEAAAKAAGLSFTVNPVTHQTLNMDMVAVQKAAWEDATGPVLAYCASGTRSSIVWSLGQAGQMATDAIIEATAKAGYDLAGMRGQLDGLAQK
ncbi:MULTISPECIES: TIGR01244 family sulfur transferase [unclassified Yoonia]|uniref:TIGR01244 family sulfur transferase n=1 Tax=unclassified Yoonia TaxID=2629118 RepID=UPI002AFECABF|nr:MULTISPECIES: TIGR01244 family sulfur transferase [unclassified Yoonia]